MKNFARQNARWVLGVASLMLAVAPYARADIGSYTENITNLQSVLAGSCSPACVGPFATMTVDLIDSTHAVFTFTALSNSNYNYLIGDDSQALGLELNTTAAALDGGFTVVQSGTTTYHATFSPGVGMDSAGYFNFVVYENGSEGMGYADAASEIQFEVQNTGGTWATANAVLTNTGNDYNHDVDLHVFANSTIQISADAAAVPEPTAILLLGVMLVGCAPLVRRRRSI